MSEKTFLQGYFLDKVLPQFITVALGGVGAAIVAYFTLLSLNTRVSALEISSVRKDVLSETLEPMKSDIQESKADIKELLRRTPER